MIAQPFTCKYIHFVKVADKPKTSVWECRSNSSHDVLGIIQWYPSWRQYCFFPVANTVFNVGCMNDICTFIKTLR